VTARSITLGHVLERIEGCRANSTVTAAQRCGHLPTCHHGRSLPCHWCDWAVVTNDVTHMMALLEDADVLLASPPSDLRWALAAWLVGTAPTALQSTTVRPEVLDILDALRGEVISRQDSLLSRIEAGSQTGGALEQAAVHHAALLSVVAITSDPSRLARYLPGSLRRRVVSLNERVDAGRMYLLCASESPDLPCNYQPRIRTAPELDAMVTFRERQRRRILQEHQKGSLKELALAARLTCLTQEFHALANDIESIAGSVRVRFSEDIVYFPPSLRRTMWAQCGIDWVRTFIDISGAPCWYTTTMGSDEFIVPWFVGAVLTTDAELPCVPAVATRRTLPPTDYPIRRRRSPMASPGP
jgi:hypothetical protein